MSAAKNTVIYTKKYICKLLNITNYYCFEKSAGILHKMTKKFIILIRKII